MLKNFTLGCLAFILCGCTFKTYKYYDPPAVYEVRTYNHSHRTYHKHYVKKKRKGGKERNKNWGKRILRKDP